MITVVKDRTKNKSSFRTLPLVPEFEELLIRIKEQQEKNKALCKKSYNNEFLEYILVDEMGERIKPGFVTQNFKKTILNNGLRKIRFHDLRHSCASILLANGISMKEIQEWLGHSNYSTTANYYAHLDINAKMNSANTMRNTGIKISAFI